MADFRIFMRAGKIVESWFSQAELDAEMGREVNHPKAKLSADEKREALRDRPPPSSYTPDSW